MFKNTKSNPGFEFEMPLELKEEEDDDNEEDDDSVFNNEPLPTFSSCAETILPDDVSLVTPLASKVKDVSTVRKSLAFLVDDVEDVSLYVFTTPSFVVTTLSPPGCVIFSIMTVSSMIIVESPCGPRMVV